MKRNVKCTYWFATAAFAALSLTPITANASGQFTYQLVIDPIEGPSDEAVLKRYTRQWRNCQERARTTGDNGRCFAAEFDRQDRLLNRTWHQTLKRISPAARGQLVIAERKWISALEPFCNERAENFQGGTIMPIVYIDCQVQLRIRRTIWLEGLK